MKLSKRSSDYIKMKHGQVKEVVQQSGSQNGPDYISVKHVNLLSSDSQI